MKPELKKFFGNVLSYTREHGTLEQQNDVAGLLPQIAQNANELEDFETGIKDPKRSPHHPPEELKRSLYQANRVLGKLLREIY